MEHAAYPARIRRCVEGGGAVNFLMKRKLISLCLLPLLAFGHWAMDFDEDWAAGGAAFQDVLDGLVGWWKMDEESWDGTADEVVDSSGKGNNGTAAGGAITAEGKINRAGLFNGTTSHIDAGNGSSLDATSGITITAWAKPYSVSDVKVASKDDVKSGRSWGAGIYMGRMIFEIFASGGYSVVQICGSAIVTNEWVFVTYMFDGTNCSTYINGSFNSSTPASGTITVSASKVFVGARGDNQLFFDGLIDDLRIYNRALSSNEVSTIYNRFK